MIVVTNNIGMRESNIRYVIGVIVLLAGLVAAVVLQGPTASTVAVLAVIVTLYLIFTARSQFDPIKRLFGRGRREKEKRRRGRPSR